MTKTTTTERYRCFACGHDFDSSSDRTAPYYCNSCIDRGAACLGCDDAQETILDEAKRLTATDRHSDYGPYREEAECVAAGWRLLIDQAGECHPQARLVPLMMIWLKLVRLAHKSKRDSLVDVCGYAHLAQQLNDKETPL